MNSTTYRMSRFAWVSLEFAEADEMRDESDDLLLPTAALLGVSVFLAGLLLLPSGLSRASEPTPTGSVVRVEKSEGSFHLLRNGKPYLIRGAGLVEGDMKTLKQAGGNSVRTWGADDLGRVLDQAHALDLTVAAGIWLGQVKAGFRYDDPKAVEAQRAMVRDVVLKHKDHPALLLWGLGNEMELGVGDKPEIWEEVNHLAKMVKQLDGNHPTITCVAGIDQRKVARLKSLCPDLDILGLNSYGDIGKHVEKLKEWEWQRPYVVTEFGPRGWWECEKTEWGAPIEQTSTEKADGYLAAYLRAVTHNADRCLGSYVFPWGYKGESTPTWFGTFLPSGERLAAAELMTFAWKRKLPDNLAPRILFVDSDLAGRRVSPATRFNAVIGAYDPDHDALSIRWNIAAENVKATLFSAEGRSVHIETPEAEGAYRVFVTVLDGAGNAATANIPFFVKGNDR